MNKVVKYRNNFRESFMLYSLSEKYAFLDEGNYSITYSGKNHPFFNGAFYKTKDSLKNDDIVVIKDYFAQKNVPYYFWSDSENEQLNSVLEKNGYKRKNQTEIWSIDIRNFKRKNTRYNITRLDYEEISAWSKLHVNCFDLAEKYQDVFSELLSLVYEKEVDFNFFAYMEGNNIIGAGSYLIDSKGNCGMYNISVSNEHRSKGIGKEITEYVLEHASQRGIDEIFFTSSEDGMRIYNQYKPKMHGKNIVYCL